MSDFWLECFDAFLGRSFLYGMRTDEMERAARPQHHHRRREARRTDNFVEAFLSSFFYLSLRPSSSLIRFNQKKLHWLHIAQPTYIFTFIALLVNIITTFVFQASVFLLVTDRLVQAGHAKNVVADTISRFVPKVQHDTPISKDEMEAGLCSLLEVNNAQYVTETTDCFPPTTDDKIDFFLFPADPPLSLHNSSTCLT